MTGGGPDGKWPTRQQLCQVVEEKTVEDLKMLCPDGAIGLCRLLGSDPQKGLPDPMPDFEQRIEAFGGNWFAEKKLKAYWEYMWEAVQDKIILLLLAIGTIELIVKMAAKPEERNDGWIEPVAIYVTVLFIINVQSTMDYRRERLFDSLSAKVAASNMRFVVRNGKQVSLRDDQIVVGDIVTFNSHTAASIPADGILLNGEGVRIDESSLTGEPDPIVKDHDHPFLLSGTAVLEGQGRIVVVAVGEHSVSGKIKKAVYEEDEGESPLFEKLDRMATAIGRVGTAVALIVFAVACIQGFAVHKSEASKIIEYLLLALGILAVAVPEGLPLALTIALAISSNRMSYQNNLVKTLDACETMGSVTTICTDKTGTLTANRMTVMAAYIGGKLLQMERGKALGQRLKEEASVGSNVKELVATLIAVCSMDESVIEPPDEGSTEPKFRGNPTECAMLKFAEVCGYNYSTIREFTKGRNAMTKAQGCPKAFSSARKLMSWAVPREEGGYRVYVKGASEIVLARAVQAINATGQAHPVTEQERRRIEQEVIDPFAHLALRTIGMAYKDVDSKPDESTTNQVQNTDGTDAFVCETSLTLVGVMGIADPLRKEVPSAISQCYAAGIDVRMVTGDNLATAVAIAREAGILNAALHFDAKGELKKYRAMEGKHFRKHVYTLDAEGNQVFHQDRFDEIWPYLRVLARSSPEDKLTLAKGLSGSSLYEDIDMVRRLQLTDGINIFPDRQVIAMTGDGTNDAPALKAADVGFAMGISGTQIAKDAANIILMDDNFASIVTAAKWGRNVFDSIQKFLQFQLTVNIAILTISLVLGFAGVEQPLQLLHLLWVNMIMDSLASVALASEPPTEMQLQRPPVNRSLFIITTQMWFNMLGQAGFQVVIIIVMMFRREILPDCDETGPGTKHYTMVFNVFVLLQLFNEYNCRFLEGELNILRGLTRNPTFLTVSGITFALQVLMAQFGGKILQLHPMGLDGSQWGICVLLGFSSLVWQPFVNLARAICSRLCNCLHWQSQRAKLADHIGRGDYP